MRNFTSISIIKIGSNHFVKNFRKKIVKALFRNVICSLNLLEDFLLLFRDPFYVVGHQHTSYITDVATGSVEECYEGENKVL